MFRPGGGRGAVYVLVQMALLLLAAWLLRSDVDRRFAGSWRCAGTSASSPACRPSSFRLLRPARAASLQLRVAVLLLLPLSMLLPDVIYYVLWQPDVLDLSYSARHLVNPFRTLANWQPRGDAVTGSRCRSCWA